MKKLLTLILVFALVIPHALAEIDLASLTDDEVRTLYEQVADELNRRGLTSTESITLREGKYIIGKDIQPGNYTITCTETVGDSLSGVYDGLGDALDSMTDEDSTGYGDLFGAFGGLMGEIGMTVEIVGDYGDVLRTFDLKKGDVADILLEEGTALKLTDGSCVLEGK